MAVQTVVRGRGRRRSSIPADEILAPVSIIPNSEISDGKLKFDLNLGTLLNGEWQERRVACTKCNLCFMLPGDELIRDCIPLEEILAIDVMRDSNSLEHRHNGSRRFNKEITKESKEDDSMIPQLKSARPAKSLNAFQIRTTPDGFNSGRIYYLQADSIELRDEVIEKLRKLISTAKIKAKGTSRFVASQELVRSIYESTTFQTISALLIIVNFGSSIAEAQMESSSDNESDHEGTFKRVDLFLTLAFTVELLLNAFANWLRPFISNGWSIFDFIIVSLSLVSLIVDGMPVRLILLLRCCRVLRIFGKIPSVAKIFSALFQSLIPMINAFFIIFIIAAIYSIVGVAFFADDAPTYFGTFSLAFVAMFRITIGSLDWWFDVFPTVQGASSANSESARLLFLISYVILVNWVFFQVSIAVLLDNFLSASETMKAEEHKRMIKEKQIEKHFKNPLDPLILRLSKDYINDADLSLRLDELFKVLDSDGSGDLSSQEFQAAMKKLDISPRIFVSDSDFIAMTKNGTLCNAKGHLGPEEFANVMRQQIRLYTQQRLSSSSEFWGICDENFTELASMKQILTEILGARAEQERTSQRLGEVLSMLVDRVTVSTCWSSNHSSGTDCSRCSFTSMSHRLSVSSKTQEESTRADQSMESLEVPQAIQAHELHHSLSVDACKHQCHAEIFSESEVLKSLPDLNSFVSRASNPHGPADDGRLWSASGIGPPSFDDECCNSASRVVSGPSPFIPIKIDGIKLDSAQTLQLPSVNQSAEALEILIGEHEMAEQEAIEVFIRSAHQGLVLNAKNNNVQSESLASNNIAVESLDDCLGPESKVTPTLVAAVEPVADLAPPISNDQENLKASCLMIRRGVRLSEVSNHMII